MGNLSDSHKSARKYLYIGLIFLLLAIVAVVLIVILPEKSKPVTPVDTTGSIKGNGSASFHDKTGKLICTFGVEIAETQATRTKGLMYRESMADSTGMLFLMPKNEIQQFWMKNTFFLLI